MKKTAFLIVAFCAAHFFPQLNAQNYSVYVSDAGNFNLPPWKIFKFDENGENGEVFIDNHLAWPQDILFLEEEGTVLISNLNTNRISKFDATTGAFIGEFATGIAGPTRMEIGPEGLLYVLQAFGNEKVRRYNSDGSLVDEFSSVGVSNSIGIDWDADGNFYVSSYTDKYVQKFSPTGADLGLFINANLIGPTNIWFDGNGDLLVLDFEGAAVKRFDSNGASLGVFISGLPQCEGVEFLPNGNLLIGVGGTSSVREYDTSGNFVGNFVPPGTLGLLRPNAIVLRNEPPSPTKSISKEISFVRPNIGARFQLTKPEELKAASMVKVFDRAGTLVDKFNFTENAIWDASQLSNGIYFITVRLPDGWVARERVVVQQ